MACYIYDINTGEYKGTLENCTYVTYPFGYTNIPPPSYDEYSIPVFDFVNQTWVIYPDYRGTWYHKQTKEEVIIENIGEVIDLNEYTNIKYPNKDFYYWDDTVNNWVFDLDLYKEYIITEINKKFNSYLDSTFPVSKLISYVSTTTLAKLIMDINPDLLDTDVSTLIQIINDNIQVLSWINNVTVYKDSIVSDVLNAATKTDVDSIFDTVNFEQFNTTIPSDTLSTSVSYLQSLLGG